MTRGGRSRRGPRAFVGALVVVVLASLVVGDELNVAGYLVKPVTFVNFVDLMAALNKYWTLVEMP